MVVLLVESVMKEVVSQHTVVLPAKLMDAIRCGAVVVFTKRKQPKETLIASQQFVRRASTQCFSKPQTMLS
jgi:uncharacterized protein (DUF2384 family)